MLAVRATRSGSMLMIVLQAVLGLPPASLSQDVSPSEPDLLATLAPGHPRLLMSEADWQALDANSRHDDDLALVLARIETDAQWLLDRPPLTYKKEGKRLLDVSRQAVQRVLLWSVSGRMTGDASYDRAVARELVNLASFPDWNPSHFLDTAEMTAAVALGYDWHYHELDAASRETIRRAIVEKGLLPGLDAAGGRGSWHRAENNWNQVCFGGLTLGALAVGDEAPEPANRLLNAARTGIAAGLRPYAPDGVYPEGPGYWGYGTVYQALMLSALESALGTRWDLGKSAGFLASAQAQLELTGPSGLFYNFFDCEEQQALQPAIFWFARELEQPGLLRFQRQPLQAAVDRSVATESLYHENRLFALVALWWPGLPDPNSPPGLPLDWKGDGANPVGVFRTSWTDPSALYLAFKGGAANLSHGHMDAGSFVLEADGVRWAIDLGRQDYLSLESKGIRLWDYAQDSERWSVFRLNSASHNTLTIDGRAHRVDGRARITGFSAAPTPLASIDLSPVFAGQADRVTRHFALVDERTVTVRDELRGVRPGADVRWAMATRADLDVAGDWVTLTQGGRTLQARLVEPDSVAFSVISADPPNDDFNAPNPGVRFLTVHVPAPQDGQVTIAVELTGGGPADGAPATGAPASEVDPLTYAPPVNTNYLIRVAPPNNRFDSRIRYAPTNHNNESRIKVLGPRRR